MYKNQLQELAQRSCFNLPSYACIREGPDHAPRFKASVNFNGEVFEGPNYCTTLRQAEHAAVEVAINTLSARGPPRSLAAKVLDETGVYKNLLQETAHRAGLNLPVYTTVRCGPGHLPVFTFSVELAGMSFNGEPARTKKQAEKNAAMAAWSALKNVPNLNSLCQMSKECSANTEEQEQVMIVRALSLLRPQDESIKQIRQREHQRNILRKKMMLSCKDKISNHSTPSHYQKLRFQDLISSDGSMHSNQEKTQFQSQPHKQESIFSSPSPPSPASWKLLPSIYQQNHKELLSQPGSSLCLRETIQIRTKPQIKAEDNPSPLVDHFKDGEEWGNGVKTESSTKNVQKESNPIRTNSGINPIICNFSHPSSSNTPILAKSFGVNQLPRGSRILPLRMFCATDFPAHSMAPAVQIRSVIPVCAAPPIRPCTSSAQDQIQKQEGSSSNSLQEKNSNETVIKMADLSL